MPPTFRATTSRRSLATVVLALAVLAPACTGADDDRPGAEADADLEAPAPTTSTTSVDFRTVALPEVGGRTTTTLDPNSGPARLAGSVTGPDGAPVEGATIRIERIFRDQTWRVDLVSSPEGLWELIRVKGGIYQVRAFRPPDLAMTEPQTFFLEVGDETLLDLRVEQWSGDDIVASINPSPPIVGEPVGVAARATTRLVDADGVVRTEPLVGAAISLTGAREWQVFSTNPAVTNGSGDASWILRCTRAGEHALRVVVQNRSVLDLDLPACEVPPPPPEPEPDPTEGDGDAEPTPTTQSDGEA